METFKIEVKETLSRIIEIQANSMDEAYYRVREMYSKEEIVLDANDNVDTDFIEIED
ncbi:MAG TPA: DpnD/PcfM family protein [Ferruginibacter sp.]|nr:DpnD/PcfM family protein [Ferruginibacter sp.]HRO06207.1 DpnD/PcfM family protein [Ferruginibacter sp.]HRO97380.1 DpnD/PcfM family protein [Ferruginibacter sp.]HRP49680.1 DpnD/PcfM family protein [Ferruginibacter sp.]